MKGLKICAKILLINVEGKSSIFDYLREFTFGESKYRRKYEYGSGVKSINSRYE